MSRMSTESTLVWLFVFVRVLGTSFMNDGASLRRRKLGYGLCSFTHSVLRQFTGKHQTNCGLNFSARQSGLLVVSGKLTSLSRNPLENIINERVHNRHSLLGNSSVGMDLLQHLVDVRRVTLGTFLALATATGCLFGGSLGGLLRGSLGHLADKTTTQQTRVSRPLKSLQSKIILQSSIRLLSLYTQKTHLGLFVLVIRIDSVSQVIVNFVR